jgi:hypothetical protein
MSRALVLVAGLYVFLAPVVTNKGMKQVQKVAMKIEQGKKGTTNNRAIEVFLMCSFSLIFSFFTIFSFLFLSKLFLDFALLIFFLIKKHTRTNLKKNELNWTKDVAYTNSGL